MRHLVKHFLITNMLKRHLAVPLAIIVTACCLASCGGDDGADGLSALVNVTAELAGANCVAGGQKIEQGLDDNGNGALDPEEVDSTSYVCTGADGIDGADGTDGSSANETLVNVTEEPPGVNCADGGQKIETGVDDNGNGILEPAEVDSTAYVCSGSDGSSAHATLVNVTEEPPGANCADGGQKIEVGVDDNDDGVLSPDEVDNTSYVCSGSDGDSAHQALVTVTEEPPGENCTMGGQKIQAGIDSNDNGVLDVEEIDTTTYVCNGEDLDPVAEPESCAVCHGKSGGAHQEIYDDYADESVFELEITGVVSTADPSCIGTLACKVGSDCADNSCDDGFCAGQADNTRCNDKTCDSGVCSGEFGSTVTFTIKKNAVPYVDINMDPTKEDLPALGQKRFITSTFDEATGTFPLGGKYFSMCKATGTPGEYTATAGLVPGDSGPLTWAPETSNAVVYGYIADNLLDTESGGHVSMYDNVASAAVTYGTAGEDTYTSPANVSGCEKCHGKPYMKHGYRNPVVDGLDDFASCKGCHYDTKTGGHEDWQIMVDDPARYAEIAAGDDMTPEEEAKYAYTANIKNDVHMAHAMEFPYPQSMANCVTCHEGKLGTIQTNENFVRTTCLSCHPRTGSEEYGTAFLALESIWKRAGVDLLHDIDSATACNNAGCHDGGTNPVKLATLHNGGYNKMIYTSAGKKYSDAFVASINTGSFNKTTNTLTVEFSATEVGGAGVIPNLDADDIVPTLLIGLYGYDTRDYIVNAHDKDDDDYRLLEFTVNGEDTNPRFTVQTATGGNWKVLVDLTLWADMIADKSIRRAEIMVLPAQIVVVGEVDGDVGTCDPECEHDYYCAADNTCKLEDDITLALNAPSRTFDLGANAFADNFYTDIVDVAGCNKCHEALATTFHSANRGGNIRVCKGCHVVLKGGSHLEMQSRSIDSYVHATHSFQAFDGDEIDFTDPVEKLRYEHHIEHVFPNFTIKNCEACHVSGAFNVPDQAERLPGILSASFEWPVPRNIPDVPSYVTGPASRACGGCHRAHKINEDDANGLLAFYQHTETNGYLIEDDEDVLDEVIELIMSIFE